MQLFVFGIKMCIRDSYNYRWFTNQWTYLECGIGGFGLYVFFFVTLIITLLAKLKRLSLIHIWNVLRLLPENY